MTQPHDQASPINGTSVPESSASDREAPEAAFARFLYMVQTSDEALQQSPEAMRSVLDAFLSNPVQHREHVDSILSAYLTLWLGNQYPKPFKKVLSSVLGKRWDVMVRRLEQETDALKATVQPVELDMDIVPTQLVDTPERWKPLRAYETVFRCKVNPRPGYEVASINVILEFSTGSTVFSTWPDRESIFVGDDEESRHAQDRQAETRTDRADDGVEIGVKGAKLTTKSAMSEAVEISIMRGGEHRSKRATWAHKVHSSMVRNVAEWSMLRSPDQLLAGGFEFEAQVVVPDHLTELSASASFEVRLESWGSVMAEPMKQILPLD